METYDKIFTMNQLYMSTKVLYGYTVLQMLGVMVYDRIGSKINGDQCGQENVVSGYVHEFRTSFQFGKNHFS